VPGAAGEYHSDIPVVAGCSLTSVIVDLIYSPCST
jgi:hypothetical protein